MPFALMIESQLDVGWELNVAIAQRAEAAGFTTLYRSDHYESLPGPAGRRSTDAWATIAGLVRETTALRHGTMVSPVTFRHPGNTAKVVATVDEMSDGRVELGLGAGWHSDEHRRHGLAFPDRATRLAMLEEQLQIVGGLWSGVPGWSFDGRHYRVEAAAYAPVPVQRPRPPLIVGTSGVSRSLRMAARWADHVNIYKRDPAGTRVVFERLDAICSEVGRPVGGLTRSVVCGVAIGEDRGEADRRRQAAAETLGFGTTTQWEAAVSGEWAIGTPDQAARRIREFAGAGADVVVFEDFLPQDLEHIDLLGALSREWAS